MRFDAVLDQFSTFGVRADSFFRSPNGARDWVAVFGSLNAPFAANPSAWDSVRNASPTPSGVARYPENMGTCVLLIGLWSVRHFWNIAKKARLSSIVGIFLFELPTSSRTEVSIFYRQPSRLPQPSVDSLLPHFGVDGFRTEHWDRGSWVSIVHAPPVAAARSENAEEEAAEEDDDDSSTSESAQ